MKSEFMLAFNEICEARGLSKDVVIEALETALVSAYRRNVNIGNNQDVRVEIDRHTGEPTIFAEKQVVDSIMDSRTEVLFSVATRAGHTDIELGDIILVNSTPENFGRIAAQTAKQVILQRVREAEREKLYEDFSAREGEIVNGTVQSISGQSITIGLGRTEAVLPRSQQVPGERYRAHDKIRVYVLEVRRTSRGPQIIVSRNHRSLLRRLLELEVPEIYNGQVDVKSIAREAGARSKVAVMAMQPGIDPVGACVGMRGVRIQSIVRELNDEKIDVIEWDPDQKTFIAKALSPARVSQVFLEDHPDEGKTAIVIVPDDQLSLAIGREGQNARLAAKLTGWRIDIKSLTEAASESLENLGDKAVDPAVARNKELVEQVQLVLAKKLANRPVTQEDYMVLNRLVAGVEGRIVAQRAAEYDRINRARSEARKHVPPVAWEIPLEVIELSTRVQGLLEENYIANIGALMMHLEMGDEALLGLDGFGAKALDEVKEAMGTPELAEMLEAAAAALEPEVAEGEVEAADESADAPDDLVTEATVAIDVDAETPVADEGVALDEDGEEIESFEEEVEPEAEEEEEVSFEDAIDDLDRPLVEVAKPEPAPKARKRVVVVQPTAQEEPDEEDDGRPRRGRRLVFDEQQGKVVVQRKRKGSRRRPEWEEFEDIDVDDFMEEAI